MSFNTVELSNDQSFYKSTGKCDDKSTVGTVEPHSNHNDNQITGITGNTVELYNKTNNQCNDNIKDKNIAISNKILIVGCGGLGSELVKLLSLNPSNNLTLIDDDTIDSTNLNRQFLYTKEDIGKSKAGVLCKKIANRCTASYIFGKIDQFKKIDFYKQFNIVYNCLDNDEARSFVNQRCVISDVKMVDGGSAGWLGQSFYNGKECFNCLPKKSEKIYPICTIRQRPKNFEHCLIWAKRIVEEKDKSSLIEELGAHDSNDDIENVINNDTMINSVSEIMIDSVSESDQEIFDQSDLTSDINIDRSNINESNIKESNISNDKIIIDQIDSNSNIKKFKSNNLIEKLSILKDDQTDLIYEIAILKAHRFSIKPFSLMDSQTFLKKIIPSICTTNSIVASLMILSAFKHKNYYLTQGTLNILETELNEKNRECLVCSLPIYLAKFNEKCTISEFLVFFKSELAISENNFYDKTSKMKLIEFDGEFLIILKKESKNRIYFEKGEKLEIMRIK